MTTWPPLRRRAIVIGLAFALMGIMPSATLATDPTGEIDATWTVTRPDGTVRDDASISVGDDLALHFELLGAASAIEYCHVSVWTVDAGVTVPGRVDGQTCSLSMRLPALPGPEYRERFGGTYLDLCVNAAFVVQDGAVWQFVEADHDQPYGRDCGPAGGSEGTLDFRIDEAGATDRPFVSDPPFISWDPSDWGTGMAPMAFGEPYTVTLPDLAATCTPYLNGSWQTSLRPFIDGPCEPWVVRVPGVMPAGFDHGGHAIWDSSLVVDYTIEGASQGPHHLTSYMGTPIAATDGVFESNQPAVFPVDLASTRFVTAGEPWRPTFQVSGIDEVQCRMTLHIAGETDLTWIYAPVGPDGRCTFDLPARNEGDWNQYYIEVVPIGSQVATLATYGSTITGIAPVPPPVMDPPTLEPDDDAVIEVDPGGGQGLLVELGVEAVDVAGDLQAAATTGGPSLAATVAAAESCADHALSPDLESGGGIPALRTICDLPAGTYRATATKLDVAGGTTTASRTFTVPYPRPRVSARSPGSGVGGVARDVRPSVTFDVPVTGVSTSTVRLVDTVTGTAVPSTVTYDAASRRATIRPTSLLRTSRAYRVQVTSGVQRAVGGRAMAATSWTFTTTADGTAPTISGRAPASGATLVWATATPAIRFSEGMKGINASTLRIRDTVTGAFVSAIVAYDPVQRRATIDPTSILRGGRRYEVVVRAGIADTAGNRLSATSWSFTIDPRAIRTGLDR